MTTEHKPHQAYFSDRCPRTVFGNDTASPCSLKLGHEGECLPVPLPRSVVSNQHKRHQSSDFQSVREGLSEHEAEYGVDPDAWDALQRIEEQYEVLDSALRDILDIVEGWTPAMDPDVRIGRIGAYATEALKAVKSGSNPAFGPRIQNDSDPTRRVSGASPEGDDGDTGAETPSPAIIPHSAPALPSDPDMSGALDNESGAGAESSPAREPEANDA